MGRRGTSSIIAQEVLILLSFDNKDTLCSLRNINMIGQNIKKEEISSEIKFKKINTVHELLL
jgi:hypothetical protein